MPEKLDRCVKAVMESGKSEESAYAICQAQFKDSYKGTFRDSVVFNPSEKTAISVRDGVLHYLGAELNMTPPDQMFTVYRSPATIANAAMKMNGLPVTVGHVTLDIPAPTDGGFVSEASMVDAMDPSTHTTIAVRNRLAVSDTMLMGIEAGNKELSLGYNAELVPFNGEYDFEQINIQPHHLAAVERGRCGPMCSFIDRQPTTPKTEEVTIVKNPKLHKAFKDQEGELNLQQIVELATALPEAIKSVPVDMLKDLIPALQQIVEAAKGVMPETETPETPPEPTGEMEDEESDVSKEDRIKKFGDAVAKENRLYAETVEKARAFLPDSYKFADKTTVQIMRDAVATESSEQFTDADLPLVFKMLKKPATRYQNFGDAQPHNFDSLKNKEL
jgi:hypothetical protein